MEMFNNRWKNSNDLLKQEGIQEEGVLRLSRTPRRWLNSNRLKVVAVLGLCFLGFSVLLPAILRNSPFYGLAWVKDVNIDSRKEESKFSLSDSERKYYKFLGGLLPEGLDESSCLSRYQSYLLRKKKPRLPSSHLISRLRKYEALHRQCGPNTDSYKKALEQLDSGSQRSNASACKYLVWTPHLGLGNRMLTMASSFLYALLTNRVLLIGHGGTIADLFCEPFPGGSWLLPSHFPVDHQFKEFGPDYPHSYGNMLKNKTIGESIVPPFVYLHLASNYGDYDKLFFCDQDQTLLQKVPWLILRSDLYFVPSLFMIKSFREELNNLFPEKETIFHHLGRYLFHPTNSVWGLIVRYYKANLAKADEKLGIQLRFISFAFGGPPKQIVDQILACTIQENLLPEINLTKIRSPIKQSEKQKTKSVLITSLKSGYYKELRNMYSTHETVTGEVITFHQPSHEENERHGDRLHDRKALVEIYLLSLSDKLVTSSWSTFGYVAQSLGGLKPLILYKAEAGKMADPPCLRGVSMEPCFHIVPAIDVCRKERGVETESLVPYVRQCEDVGIGLKLFDT